MVLIFYSHPQNTFFFGPTCWAVARPICNLLLYRERHRRVRHQQQQHSIFSCSFFPFPLFNITCTAGFIPSSLLIRNFPTIVPDSNRKMERRTLESPKRKYSYHNPSSLITTLADSSGVSELGFFLERGMEGLMFSTPMIISPGNFRSNCWCVCAISCYDR